MKRIRDYFIGKALADTLNKSVDYLMEEDLPKIDRLVIKNTLDNGITPFKDSSDLDLLRKLADGLDIEFNGFDMRNLKLQFSGSVNKITFVNCNLEGTSIVVFEKNETYEGYDLILDRVVLSNMDVGTLAIDAKSIAFLGKQELKLTKEYTVEQISTNILKDYPTYLSMPHEEQVKLMKQYGYLQLMKQSLSITNIHPTLYLKTMEISNVEIIGLDVTNIYKAKKCKKVVSNIKFMNCKFSNNNEEAKLCVDKLVLEACTGDVSNVLSTFLNMTILDISNIEKVFFANVFNPNKVEKLKIINSVIDMKELLKFKNIVSLAILDENIAEIECIKKLHKLSNLVVTKGSISEEMLNSINEKRVKVIVLDEGASQEISGMF